MRIFSDHGVLKKGDFLQVFLSKLFQETSKMRTFSDHGVLKNCDFLLVSLSRLFQETSKMRIFSGHGVLKKGDFLQVFLSKLFQETSKMIKGSLGGETSVLRTFRMSGKELVKERVSEGKS